MSVHSSKSRFVASFLVVTTLVACEEPVRTANSPGATSSRSSGRRARTRAAAPADAGVASPDAALVRVYKDEDFVEADVLNRDPFRDFVVSIADQAPVNSGKTVKMHDVSLEQMRLIAVITGVPIPYAMITDPTGIGHVVVRGDYIGRDEMVNIGGADGMPVALNWKIDRIRSGELVLTREDPLHPDQPPLTRSMLLRDARDAQDLATGAATGQLGNTGDRAAPAPVSTELVAPGGGGTAPAPMPMQRAPGTMPSGSYGETAPLPPPPTTSATPTAPSSSRFGGVFGRRVTPTE